MKITQWSATDTARLHIMITTLAAVSDFSLCAHPTQQSKKKASLYLKDYSSQIRLYHSTGNSLERLYHCFKIHQDRKMTSF